MTEDQLREVYENIFMQRRLSAPRPPDCDAAQSAAAAAARATANRKAMLEIVAKYREITNSQAEHDLCSRLLGDGQ